MLCARSSWGGIDPEDPWEEALDALEAKRRDAAEAAADRENAEDGVAMGWQGSTTSSSMVKEGWVVARARGRLCNGGRPCALSMPACVWC